MRIGPLIPDPACFVSPAGWGPVLRALLERDCDPCRRVERADDCPLTDRDGKSAPRLSFAEFLERENLRIARERSRLGCGPLGLRHDVEPASARVEDPAPNKTPRIGLGRRFCDLSARERVERAYRPAPAPTPAEFVDVMV